MDIDPRLLNRTIAVVERRLSIPYADREDFRQDAWVHLLVSGSKILARFGGRSAFATYLFRVVLNFGINWTRTRQRADERRLSLDLICPSIPWRECGAALSPEERLCAIERARRPKAVLSQLSRDEREVLMTWAVKPPRVHNAEPAPDHSQNAIYCRVSRLLRKARGLASASE